MLFVIYMTFFCFGSWGLLGGLFFRDHLFPVFLGMLAPWMVGLLNIIMVKKTFTSNPEKMTALMTKAFIGKMVFYGIYIIIIFTFGTFQQMPFVLSFTGYFILLHILEALYFRATFNVDKTR